MRSKYVHKGATLLLYYGDKIAKEEGLLELTILEFIFVLVQGKTLQVGPLPYIFLQNLHWNDNNVINVNNKYMY